MKQEINFLRLPARPPRPVLGSAWIGWTSVALMAVLGGTSLYENRQQTQLKERIAAAEARGIQLEAQIRELAERLPEPQPSLQLLEEANRLQRSLDSWRHLLQAVGNGDWIRRRGFSPFFEGLARQADREVWLTGILLSEGGARLELSGSATESARIPDWVRRLGSEPVFRARTFGNLVVRRPNEPGRVDFKLRTEAVSEGGNARNEAPTGLSVPKN